MNRLSVAPVQRVRKWWERLTEPLVPIEEADDRRKARMLASLELAIFITLVATLPLPLILNRLAPLEDADYVARLFGAGGAFAIYLGSRFGYYYGLGKLAVLASTAAIFWFSYPLTVTFGVNSGTQALNYLVVTTLFSSLFLSMRFIILLFTTQTVGIFLVPLFVPRLSYSDIFGGTFYFHLVANTVVILFAYYRQRLESERRAELAQSEARYRSLFENVQDMVYDCAPTGAFIAVNEVAEKLIGWSCDELIGQAFVAFVHPDDLPLANEMFQRALRGEQTPPFALRMRTKAGEYLWMELKAGPRHDQTGQKTVFGVARDITERKRAEQALRASEERYHIISDLISDYAYCLHINADGEVTREWLTGSFTRVTGYQEDEIDLAEGSVPYAPEEAELVRLDRQKLLRGEVTTGEYRIVTKGGQLKWLRIYRQPVWDSQHERVVRYYGVAQDITERKQAEAQQLKLALQQERLGLARRFFHAISHDFRTNLATIETSRYLIEYYLSEAKDERVQPKLDNIAKAVRHVTQQLENLQTVTSLVDPRPVNCNVNRLLETVMRELSPSAQAKRLLLMFEPQANLPTIQANEDDLRRAIKHLLSNAINFTPSEGMVRLRTTVREGRIAIEVSDTGIGMTADEVEHIFDMFYRAEPARPVDMGGVGLGLSIVKMIVEAHNGVINVASQPGKGSVFTILLPLDSPSPVTTLVG